MNMHKRRSLCRLLMIGAASFSAMTTLDASAQGKTSQIVVPYAPGGTTDILARLLANGLQPSLGPVIVDNRPGAGSAIGAGFVARAPRDGKTLLMATSTTLAINPWLYKKLPYNPTKDFTPIAQVAEVPLVLVVNTSVEVSNVAELIKFTKTKGALNYASAGNGSPHHLIAEMFKTIAKADLSHVPYKGSSPALTDVLAGHIPVMFADIAPAMPFIQSKRLKALAVTSSKRVAALPDVPTIAETKIPELSNFEGVAWQGIVGPANLPQDIVDNLSAEVIRVMSLPDVKNKLEKEGVIVRTRTTAQFRDYIASELARWEKVVKTSGATVE